VALAQRLAADRRGLAETRAGLRPSLRASALCDARRLAHDFLDAAERASHTPV